MTYDIIISRYNEDIQWTHYIDEKWKIYLYNKGNDINDLSYIKKENCGRESETYISHIIENYENLADYNCFCQGHPFDHSPDFLFEIKNFTAHDHFYAFDNPNGVYAGKFDGIYLECDVDGAPQHGGLQIIDFCKKINLNIQTNKKIKFTPGAQFIINKKNILKHDRDFYINLNNILINSEYSEDGPYILERIWNFIF
jgi:hypothetical protein